MLATKTRDGGVRCYLVVAREIVVKRATIVNLRTAAATAAVTAAATAAVTAAATAAVTAAATAAVTAAATAAAAADIIAEEHDVIFLLRHAEMSPYFLRAITTRFLYKDPTLETPFFLTYAGRNASITFYGIAKCAKYRRTSYRRRPAAGKVARVDQKRRAARTPVRKVRRQQPSTRSRSRNYGNPPKPDRRGSYRSDEPALVNRPCQGCRTDVQACLSGTYIVRRRSRRAEINVPPPTRCRISPTWSCGVAKPVDGEPDEI